MKFRRILSLAMILLMLCAVFVSCGGNKTRGDDTSSDGDNSGGSDDSVTTTVDPCVIFNVPESLKFTDEKFTVFTWSNQTHWEWDAEEETGDTLKDAIYKRKVDIEAGYGLTLNIIKQPGEWENRSSFIQSLSGIIRSGNQEQIDLVGQYTPAAALGAMEGLYQTLNDVEYIDYDKKWWPGDIKDACSINKKAYFMTGDITPTLIRQMSCIYANLELADAYGLPDVYEIVKKNEWTLDKLLEISVGKLPAPTSGQTYNAFALINNVVFDSLFYGGGFKFVDVNADGSMELSQELSGEKMVTWFDKCNKAVYDNPDVVVAKASPAAENDFTGGNTIFLLGNLSIAQNYLLDAPFKFAVLPMPKYDTNQENYHTDVGFWVTMYSIPTNAPNTTKSGAIMQALGYYGYKRLTPAFYENAFKYRFLVSEDNARMLDLLHDAMTYDIGHIFADPIGCFAAFRQASNEGASWSKFFKSYKKLWEKNVGKIYDKLA